MEEKRVKTSRGTMVYLEGGSGRHLLFLHGAVATPRAYIPLLKLLAKQYHVIAPTHPGHGDSFAIDDTWTLEDFIASYREFLEKLNLPKTPILGHSFGGTLAILLANEGLATQVVAMDPPGLPITFTMRSFLLAKKKELQAILDRYDRTQIREAIAAAATLLYTARRHPRELSWFTTNGPKLNITAGLSKFFIPISFFWGADDGIVPVSVGRKMHELTPGSTLTVFPGRGHNYPVFEPEFTHREITKAIRTGQTGAK